MHTAAANPILSPYRWVMASMSLVGHLALGFNLFGISPVLPLAIADYGISNFAAGLLGFLYPCCWPPRSASRAECWSPGSA